MFACPRFDCQRTFITRYVGSEKQELVNRPEYWKIEETFPFKALERGFEETIQRVSTQFVALYNQAYSAEQHKLALICGAGYRKSLEFLVKDYAKSKNPKDQVAIEKTQLGPCIQNYIVHPKVVDIAKRAVWLGNDETHYVKKWEDKDLADLKALIDLTVHWISMDRLSDEVIADMPDPATVAS